MRHELEKVKAIMQKAANSARVYNENIAHVRRTCRPEMIEKETEVFAKSLKQAVDKARAEAFEQLDSLIDTIKDKAKLRPEDYAADVVEFMRAMTPGAVDLEGIAKQFEGNETMLRFFHKYRDEQKLIAELPAMFSDKLKHVQKIRNDLEYAFNKASTPLNSNENRYGHAMLQSWAESFEKVFADNIAAIGEF